MNTVILPSREKGPAIYPNPPSELIRLAEQAKPLHELIAAGIL